MNHEQLEKVRTGKGFIAALDQSGGSTPKALALYGIGEDQYEGEEQMFDRMHEMRSRIITSPSFGGDRVLGAILFEGTMDRQIEGVGTGEFLWSRKGVVPFLKVDKGLADEVDGAQVMKPMPGLDELLSRAVDKGMFGTKMRSVIKLADQRRGRRRRRPAVRGRPPDPRRRARADHRARGRHPQPGEGRGRGPPEGRPSCGQLDQLPEGQQVMLKLTLPDADGFYAELAAHPKVARVVALSGGYTRDDANERLARNPGIIASFSRALTEGLSAEQSDDEFNAMLDAAIKGIYEASIT